MKVNLYMAAAALLFTTTIGAAYAAKSAAHDAGNDALAITDAKISLAQAISAAERHVGGKASRAEYERQRGQWVFDVEVVKDRKVMDVTVNSSSGAVIAAVEDQADRKDDHDRDD